jgi:hypothetical protein
MRKQNRIPSALKHGIHSGIGWLPTESRAKFRKFKKQLFTELAITGPLEQDLGDEIFRLEWRRKNLSTYLLAKRARAWQDSIHSKWLPPPRWELQLSPEPETRSLEELDALRQRAIEEIRAELGATIELVELGEIVTYEFLEEELALRDRLDEIIARLYKKLAYVRAIKSMSPASLPAPAPALLKSAAQDGGSLDRKH